MTHSFHARRASGCAGRADDGIAAAFALSREAVAGIAGAGLCRGDEADDAAIPVGAASRRGREDEDGDALIGIERRIVRPRGIKRRSEEHTSELQSLMRTSYAVFCLQQNNKI